MPGTETAKLWTQRMRRFDQADMTVAKFCDSEGVSQPSFYHWKRKLRGSAATTQRKSPPEDLAFLPVSLPSLFLAERPAAPSHIVTTIELPGGIRIRVETPVDQADTTPSVMPAHLEASR